MLIFQIRSDKENYTKIFYSLSGPGVDKPPINRFRVDQNTGFVTLHSILDREEISEYIVRKRSFFFPAEFKLFALEVEMCGRDWFVSVVDG